jgi:glycine hydroxymethyltransferase
MNDFLFRGSLKDLDPDLQQLSDLEAERQFRRLILIPSESTSPMAVREALGTAFHNVYAEGYPAESTRQQTEPELLDLGWQLANYRRYGDQRYYKGVEYVNVIEALTRRRCSEAFAANGYSAEDLHVNVQPLSGAPANNAVYHALIDPGDTVLGMDLTHGGHLTHGSPVNRSGKLYNAVHYIVDPETERLDLDQVEALAIKHQPRIIVAGYSSYPWMVDWERFRRVADKVGAFLFADVAHVAGLIVAGIYPSPVGHAHVISFTTHKSLCGPRGAAIITTDPKLGRKIDRAVFPGEQGGPHINTMVAQALAFKLAKTEQFELLQQNIVKNCLALTDGLLESGLKIAFGGTNTHLTNVDCRSIVGDDGTTLSGDMAARILDLIGIVCNRNTIPGDTSALRPSGIRLGTPWITQRGFDQEASKSLGELIGKALHASRPYSYPRRLTGLPRAKIDFDRLHELRSEVRPLAAGAGIDYEPMAHDYPHYSYLDDPLPEGPYVEFEMRGTGLGAAVRWLTDLRPSSIEVGTTVQGTLRGPGGKTDLWIERKGDDDEDWGVIVPKEAAAWVRSWFRDLSDGFVTVDSEDLQRKIPGPFLFDQVGSRSEAPAAKESEVGSDKPWYLGVGESGSAETLPTLEWAEPASDELRRTSLFETHAELGAKMVPFAGWEMPVWYSSVREEHQAVRSQAGLFDVTHMGVYQIDGEGADAFLDSVVANDVGALQIGESHYTQFLSPTGEVIDDLMIYRRQDSYLLVVNAANDEKDWAWLSGVLRGELRIDSLRPWSRAYGRTCRLRDLRNPESGPDMRVDIALQGPSSREILLALGCSEAASAQVQALPWAGVMEGTFGGLDLIVSHTGYTGERVAYELFVHPDRAVNLWTSLLSAGEGFGLKPAGLGARDSLRTEAGLPLYGHEMAGEMALGVGDAGFIGYVKTYKPWFIGRDAVIVQEAERTGEVARFRFDDRGVRMAHYGDPVVDRRGKVVGKVTSCAVDQEGFLLGQAYLERSSSAPGTEIGIFQGGIREQSGAVDQGDRVSVPTPATVVKRFPS